jgi:nucleotide-binding universal stress UspA family protein
MRGDAMSGSTIVVGTDGSSTPALRRAGELAASEEGRVVLVSAYRPVSRARLRTERRDTPEDLLWMVNPHEEVDERLAKARERLASTGVAVETRARRGSVAESILHVADEEEADLIVVGTKGQRGSKRFLPRIADMVARHADCDVMIVRADAR